MTLRQRDVSVECPAFLDFVRGKPCCACGEPPRSQAAHLKLGNPEIGKGHNSRSDRWMTPLCSECHLDGPKAQHKVGERKFWRAAGVDPFAVADACWREFCAETGRDVDAGDAIKARSDKLARRRACRAKKRAERPKPAFRRPRGPKRNIPSRPFQRRRGA